MKSLKSLFNRSQLQTLAINSTNATIIFSTLKANIMSFTSLLAYPNKLRQSKAKQSKFYKVLVLGIASLTLSGITKQALAAPARIAVAPSITSSLAKSNALIHVQEKQQWVLLLSQNLDDASLAAALREAYSFNVPVALRGLTTQGDTNYKQAVQRLQERLARIVSTYKLSGLPPISIKPQLFAMLEQNRVPALVFYTSLTPYDSATTQVVQAYPTYIQYGQVNWGQAMVRSGVGEAKAREISRTKSMTRAAWNDIVDNGRILAARDLVTVGVNKTEAIFSQVYGAGRYYYPNPQALVQFLNSSVPISESNLVDQTTKDLTTRLLNASYYNAASQLKSDLTQLAPAKLKLVASYHSAASGLNLSADNKATLANKSLPLTTNTRYQLVNKSNFALEKYVEIGQPYLAPSKTTNPLVPHVSLELSKDFAGELWVLDLSNKEVRYLLDNMPSEQLQDFFANKNRAVVLTGMTCTDLKDGENYLAYKLYRSQKLYDDAKVLTSATDWSINPKQNKTSEVFPKRQPSKATNAEEFNREIARKNDEFFAKIGILKLPDQHNNSSTQVIAKEITFASLPQIRQWRKLAQQGNSPQGCLKMWSKRLGVTVGLADKQLLESIAPTAITVIRPAQATDVAKANYYAWDRNLPITVFKTAAKKNELTASQLQQAASKITPQQYQQSYIVEDLPLYQLRYRILRAE